MSNSIVSSKSYGVDVASYQSTTVNYAGAKFAFVKLTEGTEYTNPKAETQIKSAKAHGLMVMGYFYANHSASVSRAMAEAKYAVAKAKAYGIPTGSFLADDWEQGSGNSVNGSASANTDAILAAMQVIKEAGYKPLIYSGAYNLRNRLSISRIVKSFGTCLWVASYKVSGRQDYADFNYFPSMAGVAIWQFTDNYRGLGVDGNICLIDLKISSSSSKSKPANKAVESLSQHPVVKWDIGAVAVVSNAKGAYVYTSSKLDKKESSKLKPCGSVWQVLGLENGAVKVGKNQYFDGRAVYVKANPIAYNDSKHAVAKIVMPHTHALDAPKADAGKVYGLALNSKIEIQGRVGRFLRIKEKHNGKTVYVTGNRAYIVL
ncbi:MAG: GH25 family lysozyme [Lactobacillus helveticus]|uniref:GH25 family lysozyme n=1 Tax=Lactobacillus helveticus TaxID=1587 RepID=UPI00035861B7|nr:GH25 family lysozyme [Lactobacillus helveticus]AGQ23671.1 putative lysin [Lactobacillus helveticus CNRZ32]KXN77087.1 lysin [Lactobacillus helveticus]MBW7999329.1 lysin [Lactobacillus helveticus]MBW8063247.1 lysin [Lactobacillus helveticus]MCT3406229.1 lysin [Lactobacillus helveticus]